MLSGIVDTQQEQIKKGAKILAQAVADGKLINVIGPGGHSNMAVEEVLWRAGGLVHVNPILDPGTNIIHGAKRSNIVERTPGYAKAVLDSYRVGKGDVLIIVNAYGINSMTIDTALLCKERGITSIGITSTSYAGVPKDAPSRHPSGQNLCDLVDVYIDNHLPYGDSVIAIDGLAQKMGSTSTYANCFTMNLLMMETAQALTEMIDRKQHNRHPSGLNLYELADVVIDDYTPYGEAIVPIEGMDDKVSPASTIINLFIVDAINAEVCQVLTDRGTPAEVWRSGNKPDGDRKNQENLGKYFGTLRHL